MQPMDDMDDKLHQFFSPLSHMHSVVNNEVLRKAYSESLPLLSAFSTEIGQNKILYQAIKSLHFNNGVEKKILDDEIKGFELSGVSLSGENKARFKEIQAELSNLSNQFENNLLDATNQWKLVIKEKEKLKGLPEHTLKTANSLSKNKDEWILTLDFPCFYAVMTYCEDRELRKTMYEAYVTRASDVGPDAGRFDNGPIIEKILKLRHEKACLLGFDNYTEVSLAPKMAASSVEVKGFLLDLAEKSIKQAKEEFLALKQFAQIDDLQAFDIAYYSEKQRKSLYDISQETLRPYFPEGKVLKGMFALVTRLYGIAFYEVTDFDSYHPDLKLYRLEDNHGSTRGYLYIDLYARENKRGGAWMDDCRSRRRLSNDKIQTPIAFLTCNFAPGGEGEKAYLSHDEVVTLFHEFGHSLHHLLTKVDYLAVSGINGVEWDAVELPSQFFENFCFEKEVLVSLSAHKETGEPLSDALYQKLIKAKNFQSAMAMVRQIEFSLFDLEIHLNYQQDNPPSVLETLQEIRNKYSVNPYPDYNRFPHSFSHIFAGGYASGYYSYKWAEVLSSDAYSRFEEEGIFNPDCGHDFLQQILEVGGSRKAMDSFIAFRGRAPKVDALLKHNGINV